MEQVTCSDNTGNLCDGSVPLGSSVVSTGSLSLGPLSLACDGQVAGQLWGAGAALASYLLFSAEGKALLADRPDVVEVGAG